MRGPGKWGDTQSRAAGAQAQDRECHQGSLSGFLCSPGGLFPASLSYCASSTSSAPSVPTVETQAGDSPGTPLPREGLDPAPVPGTLSWALQFCL